MQRTVKLVWLAYSHEGTYDDTTHTAEEIVEIDRMGVTHKERRNGMYRAERCKTMQQRNTLT